MLQVEFLVVDSSSPFNAVMGQVWVHAKQGVVSTLHQVICCLSPNGTYTINTRGSQELAKRCYALAFKTYVENVEEPLTSDK